jgi:ABC-2 type transport system ATP-binding protein
MNIIETRQLSRKYGRSDALHGLDLTVPAGSIFAFIGPNGAGKTTTIKILMNLIEPTGGEARVLGVDSRKLTPRERRQIGYVSENQRMPEWMTVDQLMRYCRPLYPTWDRELEKRLMRQFELPPDRRLSHLSRGMAMKAALLSSLAYRPRLLVLDEPFSGLDPLVRDEFIKGALVVSQQEEWTIFVSSHDINEVEQLADRVGIIDAGRLHLAETVAELQGRFRRIELTAPEDHLALVDWPESWLEVERVDNFVRAVETGYSERRLEEYRHGRLEGMEIAVKPMTLREIFVVVARVNRAKATHSAA